VGACCAGLGGEQARVTAPIIEATKPRHIDDGVAALDLDVTDDERPPLESAYEPHYPSGF